MQKIFLLTVSAALLLGGCGKKPAPATTNADQSLVGQVNPALTEQLRIFTQQKGRLPTDFAELISGLDSQPRKPAGMKWAIDSVTREVKLVKE